MKKRVVAAMLCACMAFGLAACGSGSSGDTTTDTTATDTSASAEAESSTDTSNATYIVRIGMPTAGKHFSNYLAEQFEAEVESASNGEIDVQIYPSSQLGTATQMIQGVQDGSIEAVELPSSYFVSSAPASAVTDLPFLYEDTQELYEVLNDEENPINDYMEELGFTVASWYKGVPRYILSQKKYASLDELNKQKIWCLPSTVLQAEMESYGISPQTLDPSDIAVSLENGTVDGVQTDAIFMNSQGLGESAKYLNEVPGTPMVNLFAFSTDWLATLPEDIQTLLLDTAKSVVEEKEVAYVDQAYENAMAALEEAGVEIVETDEALVAEMKEASKSVIEDFIATDSDCEEIYNAQVELIEAYRAQ